MSENAEAQWRAQRMAEMQAGGGGPSPEQMEQQRRKQE